MDSKWIRDAFLDFVQIDSHSLQEGKMAERLKAELLSLGFEVHVDEAGAKLQGQTGNIIATLAATAEGAPVMLAAHMDTVRPGEGVKPRVDDAGVVWSDGTTVLGADDKAGVTAILAAVRELVQKKIPHGQIQVVFTIGEEIGLQGAKNLDTTLLSSRLGLSLDSGGCLGTLVVAGPAQAKWRAEVTGRAAHAGVAPERGVSAIRVAAQAVTKMPHGRIDDETTVNIGSFVGEGPTNVVRDKVTLLGEARSRDDAKLERVLSEIDSAFHAAAAANGGEAAFESTIAYGGFRFGTNDEVRLLAEKAIRAAGHAPRPVEGGGGSDANIYTNVGIPTINIGVGYEDIHSTSEHISLSDIEGAAEIALQFCVLAQM